LRNRKMAAKIIQQNATPPRVNNAIGAGFSTDLHAPGLGANPI